MGERIAADPPPPVCGGEGRGGGLSAQDRLDWRTARSRDLRRDATAQERTLWKALKLLSIDGHFRRQAPIGPYFADFAHHGLRLIIELDGGQHGMPDGKRRDQIRTRYLEAAGYRLLRFWNTDVDRNLEGVMHTIADATSPPTPNPSPPQAGGGEIPHGAR